MATMTRARSVSCSTPPTSPHLDTTFKQLSTPPLTPSVSSANSDDHKDLRSRRRSTSCGDRPLVQSLGLGLVVAHSTPPAVVQQQQQQPQVLVTPYRPELNYPPTAMKGFQSTVSPVVHFYPPHYAPPHPQQQQQHPAYASQYPPYYQPGPPTPPHASSSFAENMHANFRSVPPSPPVTPTPTQYGYLLENGMAPPQMHYPAPPPAHYPQPQGPYIYPPPMYQSYPIAHHHHSHSRSSSGTSTPTPYWQMPFMNGAPAPAPYHPYMHGPPAPYPSYPMQPRMSVANRLMDGEAIVSKGIVKFFIVQKGYGFIRDQHADQLGTDVFVHYTAIHLKNGFRCLAEGEEVEYTLVKAIEKDRALITHGPKPRFQALGVTGPNGADVRGPSCPKNTSLLKDMAYEAETRKKAHLDGVVASDNYSNSNKPKLMKNGRPRKPPVVPQFVEVPAHVARKVVVFPQ